MTSMGHANMTSAPAPSAAVNKKKLIMHMEFYWGTIAGVLYNNWPGTRGGVHYAVSLLLVFVLAVLAEWVGRIQIEKTGGVHRRVTALLRAVVYTVKVGLANLVMLAVMSFNGGVFLEAVAGHTVGFMVFGARVFSKSGGENGLDDSDLNGLHC